MPWQLKMQSHMTGSFVNDRNCIMHAQQYCLVWESLPSVVLGRRRLELRDGGVDESSDSELESILESGFTSTPQTKLSPGAYFAPKSLPSTIALTRNNCIYLPEFFVVSTSINSGPGL